MNKPMADEKIEEIVEKIADEMQDDHDHEGQSEVEEIMGDLAEEMYDAEDDDAEEDSEELDDDEEEYVDDAPRISVDDMDPMRVLEAILFATATPLSPQAILERMPQGSDLNILLPQLKEQYEGRGVELVEIGGQYALRTAADVGEALIVEKEVSRKMSKAALETLSIVAYHQPITRAEIENIRGVATNKGTLDILMEMGWVRPGRRRETPGRPLTWLTTNNFLDHFQLESLMDLPGLDDLKASGLLDRRAAIDTIPDTGDLFDNPDADPEEILDQSDDDAYDEATYKEIKARQKAEAAEAMDNHDTHEEQTGEDE